MAHVQVIQRHAHLAGPVRLDIVNGREGRIARALLTAISNTRRGSVEERQDEATAIQWTVWGRQAENAAEYLGRGSHVNIVGRLRNNRYQDAEGRDVFTVAFTAEEIDYLDSRAESDARRARDGTETAADAGANRGTTPGATPGASAGASAGATAGATTGIPASSRNPRSDRQPAEA